MTMLETELPDRVRISDLLYRYYSAIDDKTVDRTLVDATFSADGTWTSPAGNTQTGRAAIASQQITAIAHFRATHHVTSDHVIDIDGDTARLRANVTAMHLWAAGDGDPAALESHFVAGGVFHGQAVRTQDGWRLQALTLRISWRTGALPVHLHPDTF